MGYGVTIFFYLMIGVGIAMALGVSDETGSSKDKIFERLTAPFFWPIYVPVLLANRSLASVIEGEKTRPRVNDGMSQLIGQVESELETAFGSLEGWAQHVFVDERNRITELKVAWHQQADRIREPDPNPTPHANSADQTQGPSAENQTRIANCEQTRRENLAKLKAVRTQMYDNLMSTLAWVRELVTMIHLAKYTGAPASRAEELVRQIASAVEGLTK